MITENYIRKELKNLTETIDEADFDIKSYIEKRLKQYSEDNNDNFDELRQYFANNVDVVQPTNAQEEDEAYLKLLHDFLDSEGY